MRHLLFKEREDLLLAWVYIPASDNIEVTVGVQFLNWVFFLSAYAIHFAFGFNLYSFALLANAVNVYSPFCSIAFGDIYVAYCTLPRATLGIDVICWYYIDNLVTNKQVGNFPGTRGGDSEPAWDESFVRPGRGKCAASPRSTGIRPLRDGRWNEATGCRDHDVDGAIGFGVNVGLYFRSRIFCLYVVILNVLVCGNFRFYLDQSTPHFLNCKSLYFTFLCGLIQASESDSSSLTADCRSQVIHIIL